MSWIRILWTLICCKKDKSKLDEVIAEYINPFINELERKSYKAKSVMEGLTKEVNDLKSVNMKLQEELKTVKELHLADQKELISLRLKVRKMKNKINQNSNCEDLSKTVQKDTTIGKQKWNLTDKDKDNLKRFNKLIYPMMFGVPKRKVASKGKKQ